MVGGGGRWGTGLGPSHHTELAHNLCNVYIYFILSQQDFCHNRFVHDMIKFLSNDYNVFLIQVFHTLNQENYKSILIGLKMRRLMHLLLVLTMLELTK